MNIIKKFESFNFSSIKIEDAKKYNSILNTMRTKIESIEDENKFSQLEEESEKRLDVYNPEIKEFIIDNIFYNDVEDLSDEIVKLGDMVLSIHETDPSKVLSAIDDVNNILEKY